jgi:Ni/Co efflux regulator RcnB
MNKLILTTTAIAVISMGSIASADRGRSSRGGDYHRGSDSRGSRDYGRDHGRDYGRGDHGRDYNRSRSSFSFSFGASSGGYGDSSFFGLGYSRGYSSPRYYRSSYYYAPAPVIIAPPPVVYERYYAPMYYAPTYYAPVYRGGYYCR